MAACHQFWDALQFGGLHPEAHLWAFSYATAAYSMPAMMAMVFECCWSGFDWDDCRRQDLVVRVMEEYRLHDRSQMRNPITKATLFKVLFRNPTQPYSGVVKDLRDGIWSGYFGFQGSTFSTYNTE